MTQNNYTHRCKQKGPFGFQQKQVHLACFIRLLVERGTFFGKVSKEVESCTFFTDCATLFFILEWYYEIK
jgi:hypothetical protein